MSGRCSCSRHFSIPPSQCAPKWGCSTRNKQGTMLKCSCKVSYDDPGLQSRALFLHELAYTHATEMNLLDKARTQQSACAQRPLDLSNMFDLWVVVVVVVLNHSSVLCTSIDLRYSLARHTNVSTFENCSQVLRQLNHTFTLTILLPQSTRFRSLTSS